MTFFEIVRTALNNIKINKVRSFLTMLGVIIGVFAVVTLFAIGKGFQNYIQDEFDKLGSNLIFVSPGNAGFGDDPAKSFTNNKLDEKHISLIETNASEYVKRISPYNITGANTSYKNNSYYSEITGVSYDANKIIDYQIDAGRMYTLSEQRNKANVAVLGPQVVNEIFKEKNPLGEMVKIGDESYEVIGTFKEKGDNYDDQILIPYTTSMKNFDIKNFASIVIQIDDASQTDIAMKKIELAMLRDLNSDEFTVLSQQDLLDSISSILHIVTMGIGAIGAISLLVGGIGIMNIMLVTVTERTREIGLRKAIGATPFAIALQFVSEAIIISVIGGVIGLLIAVLLTISIQSLLRAEISIFAVMLALVFSIGVGIIFGTYPAVKASKLDPIKALTFE